MVSSNSGNTWDKTINTTLYLYSSSKNDTIVIDYGDNRTETIQLTSRKLEMISFL